MISNFLLEECLVKLISKSHKKAIFMVELTRHNLLLLLLFGIVLMNQIESNDLFIFQRTALITGKGLLLAISNTQMHHMDKLVFCGYLILLLTSNNGS